MKASRIYYGSELAVRDEQSGPHGDTETGRFTLFDNEGDRRFEVRESNPNFKMVSELTALRKQFPDLVNGDISEYELKGIGTEDGVLAYRRGSVVVVVNAVGKSRRISIPSATLLFSSTGKTEKASASGKTKLPAKTLQVYRLKD